MVRLIDRTYQLLALGVKCGALVWIASYANEAIQSLAGETTSASFSVAVKVIKETGGDLWIWVLLGILGVAYGVIQKRLRRREITHFSAYVKELELKIDPNRSSSGLSPDGTTNPIDY